MIQPHPDWNQQDGALTKQFFATPTWMKIIEMMRAARPDMDSSTIEKAAMTGHRRESWEECLNTFAEITRFDFMAAEPDFQQLDTNRFSSKVVPKSDAP